MTEQQEAYARYKSAQSEQWCVVTDHTYNKLPLMNAIYSYDFSVALDRYQRYPSAVCIARNGVIMVWRKE